MEAKDGLPVLVFATAEEWEDWLERNHVCAQGVWVAIAKKGSGIDSVRYPEVLDSAICFGWIDARRERMDETRFLQRFCPRQPRSRWSQINREKARALEAEGRMRPVGLAEVERAKADGRWEEAYEPQSSALIPDDLQDALDASPAVARAFARLSAQNRYAILYRLQDARRPQTRERRLAKFVAMLEAGQTIHPQ